VLPVCQTWYLQLDSRTKRCGSKKKHTRDDDILIIIYDSCPIMSLLRRRIWSSARIIWILGCAHQIIKDSTSGCHQVAKISWFDLSDHWSFADRIIGAYTIINRVVPGFSESWVLINMSVQLRVGARTDCSMSIQTLKNPGNIKKLGGDWTPEGDWTGLRGLISWSTALLASWRLWHRRKVPGAGQ
jgi:hypothetical protein